MIHFLVYGQNGKYFDFFKFRQQGKNRFISIVSQSAQLRRLQINDVTILVEQVNSLVTTVCRLIV